VDLHTNAIEPDEREKFPIDLAVGCAFLSCRGRHTDRKQPGHNDRWCHHRFTSPRGYLESDSTAAVEEQRPEARDDKVRAAAAKLSRAINRPSGTPLTLSDGETRTLDLKLSGS
jgi:hypothetical protein